MNELSTGKALGNLEAGAVAGKAAKRSPTPGETAFDKFTYGLVNGVGVFLSSVGFAYFFKHSSVKIPGAEKTFSQLWKDAAHWMAESEWFKKFSKEESSRAASAEDFLMTTALMMGGNAFIPIVKSLENKKKEWVHKYNEKHAPDKVAEGDANIVEQPKQSWASLFTGRAMAWLTVFLSLRGADKFLSKNFGKGFGAFSEWFAKGIDKVHQAVRPNAPESEKDMIHKVGQISAVDSFATVAATTLLMVISRAVSAIGFSKKKEEAKPEAAKSKTIASVGNVQNTPLMELNVEARKKAAAQLISQNSGSLSLSHN